MCMFRGNYLPIRKIEANGARNLPVSFPGEAPIGLDLSTENKLERHSYQPNTGGLYERF